MNTYDQLIRAISNGDLDTVAALIEAEPELVNATTRGDGEEGPLPVHYHLDSMEWRREKLNPAVLRYLLENGGRFDPTTYHRGEHKTWYHELGIAELYLGLITKDDSFRGDDYLIAGFKMVAHVRNATDTAVPELPDVLGPLTEEFIRFAQVVTKLNAASESLENTGHTENPADFIDLEDEEWHPLIVASMREQRAGWDRISQQLSSVSVEDCKNLSDTLREIALYVFMPYIIEVIGPRAAETVKSVEDLNLDPLMQYIGSRLAEIIFRGKSFTNIVGLSKAWHENRSQLIAQMRDPKPEEKVEEPRVWYPLTGSDVITIPDEVGRKFAGAEGYTLQFITNSNDLETEGEEMHHCVGGEGFKAQCLTGTAHIISVRDPNGNRVSTAHYNLRNKTGHLFDATKDLHLQQHRKHYDETPQTNSPEARALRWFETEMNAGRIVPNFDQLGETWQSKEAHKEGSALYEAIGWDPEQTTLEEYANRAHRVLSTNGFGRRSAFIPKSFAGSSMRDFIVRSGLEEELIAACHWGLSSDEIKYPLLAELLTRGREAHLAQEKPGPAASADEARQSDIREHGR